MDADGLSRNPYPSQKDSTYARWHVETYEEALPGWHCSTYFSILAMIGDIIEEPIVEATMDEEVGE